MLTRCGGYCWLPDAEFELAESIARKIRALDVFFAGGSSLGHPQVDELDELLCAELEKLGVCLDDSGRLAALDGEAVVVNETEHMRGQVRRDPPDPRISEEASSVIRGVQITLDFLRSADGLQPLRYST